MYSRAIVVAVGALVSVGMLSAAAEAQHRGGQSGGHGHWEKLGCVDVTNNSDRDVIKVGRKEGTYRAIQLAASGNDVNIHDLKVVYGNGQVDDIRVRKIFRKGTKSRQIDLKGNARNIVRIIIVNKKAVKFDGRGAGRICVTGLDVSKREHSAARWEKLGCQRVGFTLDKDTIRVGRKEGSFKKIRLHVSGSPIYIAKLRVVYGNGNPDDLNVKSLFKAGTQSGAIDLKGGSRVIRQIDMLYNATPGGHNHATVCVSGLQ